MNERTEQLLAEWLEAEAEKRKEEAKSYARILAIAKAKRDSRNNKHPFSFSRLLGLS